MGRKKKYNTPEELADARKQYAKNFYERNKERLNNASMKKYYELQESLRSNSSEGSK